MRVEFDWQVGAEDGETETLARVDGSRRSRIRWWTWILVATAATSILTMALLGVCKWDQAAEDQAVVRIEEGSVLASSPARVSLTASEARVAQALPPLAPLPGSPL